MRAKSVGELESTSAVLGLVLDSDDGTETLGVLEGLSDTEGAFEAVLTVGTLVPTITELTDGAMEGNSDSVGKPGELGESDPMSVGITEGNGVPDGTDGAFVTEPELGALLELVVGEIVKDGILGKLGASD